MPEERASLSLSIAEKDVEVSMAISLKQQQRVTMHPTREHHERPSMFKPCLQQACVYSRSITHADQSEASNFNQSWRIHIFKQYHYIKQQIPANNVLVIASPGPHWNTHLASREQQLEGQCRWYRRAKATSARLVTLLQLS